MIQPLKVKQRKIYLESEFQKPTKNLFILENSARKGNIEDLENYIQEWTSYSEDNTSSLVHLLDIISEYNLYNHSESEQNKLLYVIENGIVNKVKNMKIGIHYIHEFLIDNNLPMYNILLKCNEMLTYDRILSNQKIFTESCNFSNLEDLTIEICNIVNESNISDNDKFIIALENAIYNSLRDPYDINCDEVQNIVENYFIIESDRLYEYENINVIQERSDNIEAFKGMIVTGVITGMFVNNNIPVEQALKKINGKDLKSYERRFRLTPVTFIDMELSKDLVQFVNNDYDRENIVRKEFVEQNLYGTTYKCLALYNDSGLYRLSLLYTNRDRDLVIVPVYAPLQFSFPTVISNGISKRIDESVMEVLYEKKLNKPKKKKKGSSIDKKAKEKVKELKKELAKIDFKDSKAAQKIKEVIRKFFSTSPQSITTGLPTIFDTLRILCTFGSFLINPYLGIITFATMYIMKLHLAQSERDKVLGAYDKEIKKVERKIDKCKNQKTKENYKKYLKELEDDKEKLQEWYDKYYIDEDDLDDIEFDELEESGNLVAVNELTFTNKLKLAQQNFKKAMVKMSDKEKKFSNQMDHAYDRFVYTIEKNMSNKNREAVIKGSVIPSFSALLKLALAAGTASFISPVLSAITVLGGLAASKKATANERKYILDEIDIQLDVVEKKIQLAESNNDMKSYEQLLRIKRQLESEKHRIIYKKRRPVVATKYN